jgi:hypothetical protein
MDTPSVGAQDRSRVRREAKVTTNPNLLMGRNQYPASFAAASIHLARDSWSTYLYAL